MSLLFTGKKPRGCAGAPKSLAPDPTHPAEHSHMLAEPIAYWKTMTDMQLFKDKGYRVFYMWEHHHTIARRGKLSLWSMCLEL